MKLSDYLGGESRYLKASDIPEGKELRLTIDRIEVEAVKDKDTGQEVDKNVCYFRGKEKGLVLNVTNGSKLIDAYGDDDQAMPGKEVILYRDKVEMKGQKVACIRLRTPSQEIASDDIPF